MRCLLYTSDATHTPYTTSTLYDTKSNNSNSSTNNQNISSSTTTTNNNSSHIRRKTTPQSHTATTRHTTQRDMSKIKRMSWRKLLLLLTTSNAGFDRAGALDTSRLLRLTHKQEPRTLCRRRTRRRCRHARIRKSSTHHILLVHHRHRHHLLRRDSGRTLLGLWSSHRSRTCRCAAHRARRWQATRTLQWRCRRVVSKRCCRFQTEQVA